MRGFLIGESLMNIIYMIQDNTPRINILSTRRLSLTPVRGNYPDKEWYIKLYDYHTQRYKYSLFLFE